MPERINQNKERKRTAAPRGTAAATIGVDVVTTKYKSFFKQILHKAIDIGGNK